MKKQGDLKAVKISRDKAVAAYYEKHKKKIDRVFSEVGNSAISPELKFKSWAYASLPARFGAIYKANDELSLLVDKAQYGQDYADSRRVLLEFKRENKNIDLRRKKYNVGGFGSWVDVPDDTYLIDKDTGDWNGGTLMEEYLTRYSINKEADIVLYYGYGATVADHSSPFETSGTMTIADLEGILGHAI